MTQGYARITGRVVGPEGLGRMGTLEFTPLPRYEGVLEDDSHALIAHYAVGRFREDGVLVGFDGAPGLNVAAPHSLPDGEYNYRVCINIPGDTGLTRCVVARVIAGTTIDTTELFGGTRTELPAPPPPVTPRVLDTGGGVLTAVNTGELIEIEDGLLAWRTND